MPKNNTQKGKKKNLPKIIVPRNIEVLVCSMGGVGSTFLIEHISKYKVTNVADNSDGFKHITFPPYCLNKNTKFMYIYGNPVDSVISLFRRGFHNSHSSALLNYNRSTKPIKKEMSLQEYAEAGVDRFLFESQFDNWLNNSNFYPTLFIRYESIWENIDMIYDFLDLPKDTMSSFPDKKVRSSDYSQLDIATKDNLKNIYGDFEKRLDSFGDFKIVNKSKKHLFPKIVYSRSLFYTVVCCFAHLANFVSPSFLNFLEGLYNTRRT